MSYLWHAIFSIVLASSIMVVHLSFASTAEPPVLNLKEQEKAKEIALSDSQLQRVIHGKNYTVSIVGWTWNFLSKPIIYYPIVTITLSNRTEVDAIIDLTYEKVKDWQVDNVSNEPIHPTITLGYVSKSTIQSPLKQFKSGVAVKDIQCKQGLQLVIKADDGSPACMKESSIVRLEAYHWTSWPSLSSAFDRYSDMQRFVILNETMNNLGIKYWSSTGWKLEGEDLVVSTNPYSLITIMNLYLPPNTGNPLVKCDLGWWAAVSIDLKTFQVINAGFPTESNHTCSSSDEEQIGGPGLIHHTKIPG